MKRPVRRSDTRPSSAATSPTPAANGGGAPRAELAAARSVVAESFDQGRQLLQFLVHAEQAQCEALKAWDGAVNTAERVVGQASGWDELIAAQNDLLRDGLSRLFGTQVALASSWLELQARLLQQAQHLALDSASESEPETPEGSAAPGSGRTPSSTGQPASWVEQGQAAMHAVLWPWWALEPAEQRRG
jgi:hypothetical protein